LYKGGIAAAMTQQWSVRSVPSRSSGRLWLWRVFSNKSDISYLRKSQPGLRRSDPLRQAKLCWLRLCRHHKYLATRFWCFRSQSASHCCVYIASSSQYPSRSRNSGRLHIAAMQAAI